MLDLWYHIDHIWDYASYSVYRYICSIDVEYDCMKLFDLIYDITCRTPLVWSFNRKIVYNVFVGGRATVRTKREH